MVTNIFVVVLLGEGGDQTLERSLTRSPVNFREGRRASDGLMSQGEFQSQFYTMRHFVSEMLTERYDFLIYILVSQGELKL